MSFISIHGKKILKQNNGELSRYAIEDCLGKRSLSTFSGRRQNDACTTVDDCTCGAHEVASCDSGMCHCHNDGSTGNTGNHNPPHHPYVNPKSIPFI